MLLRVQWKAHAPLELPGPRCYRRVGVILLRFLLVHLGIVVVLSACRGRDPAALPVDGDAREGEGEGDGPPVVDLDVDVSCQTRRTCSFPVVELTADHSQPEDLTLSFPGCAATLVGTMSSGQVEHPLFARAGVQPCTWALSRSDVLVAGGTIRWDVPIELVVGAPLLVATTATPGRFTLPADTGNRARDAQLDFGLDSASPGITIDGNEVVFTPEAGRQIYGFLWNVHDPVGLTSRFREAGTIVTDATVWVGAASDDAQDPRSWLPARVPDASTNVIILSDLRIDAPLAVGNLKVLDRVTITLNDRLEVAGDLTTGGTFVTDGEGILHMNGVGSARITSTISPSIAPFSGDYDGSRRIAVTIEKDVVIDSLTFLQVTDVVVEAGVLRTEALTAESLTVRGNGSLLLSSSATQPIGEGEGEGEFENIPEGGALEIAGAMTVETLGSFDAVAATIQARGPVTLNAAHVDIHAARLVGSSISIGDGPHDLVEARFSAEAFTLTASQMYPRVRDFDVSVGGRLDLDAPEPIPLRTLSGDGITAVHPLDVQNVTAGSVTASSARVRRGLSSNNWRVPTTFLDAGAGLHASVIVGDVVLAGARIGNPTVFGPSDVEVTGHCTGVLSVGPGRFSCAHADALDLTVVDGGRVALPGGCTSLRLRDGPARVEVALGGTTTMRDVVALPHTTLRMLAGDVAIIAVDNAVIAPKALIIDPGADAHLGPFAIDGDVILAEAANWSVAGASSVGRDLLFPRDGSGTITNDAGLSLAGVCVGAPVFVGPSACAVDQPPTAPSLLLVTPVVSVTTIPLPGGDPDGHARFGLLTDGELSVSLLSQVTGLVRLPNRQAMGRRGYVVEGNIAGTRSEGELIAVMGALLWDGVDDDAEGAANWRFDGDARRAPLPTDTLAVLRGFGAPPRFAVTADQVVLQVYIERGVEGVSVTPGQTLLVTHVRADSFLAGHVALDGGRIDGLFDQVTVSGPPTTSTTLSANTVTVRSTLQIRGDASVDSIVAQEGSDVSVFGVLDVDVLDSAGTVTVVGTVTGRSLVVRDGGVVVLNGGTATFETCTPPSPPVSASGVQGEQLLCGP